MIKRILGKDLEVSVVGLGCMGLSQSYPPFPKREEGIRFLRRAVEMGQTFFDTSEASVNTVRKAHEVCQVTAVQSEYSMWYRKPEEGMLSLCEELGIGFVPFSPLGKGFLTGTVKKNAVFAENDIRHTIPRFMEQENMDHNQALAQAVTEFAEKHSLAAAQVALTWLLHQKSFIVPIPGTKTESRLQENMSAAYVELADEDYMELDRILEGHTVIGARYSEATESLTDRS